MKKMLTTFFKPYCQPSFWVSFGLIVLAYTAIDLICSFATGLALDGCLWLWFFVFCICPIAFSVQSYFELKEAYSQNKE